LIKEVAAQVTIDFTAFELIITNSQEQSKN